MEVFKNSSPTASALILKKEKVLLSTRAIGPRKGAYDVIGGFLEPGEHPEAGVVREAKEETGLNIEIVDLIGVYMDDYQHQGRKSKTLNFYYVAEIINGKINPDDDVATLEWFSIKTIPTDKLAFKSQRKLINDFKNWYKKNRS